MILSRGRRQGGRVARAGVEWDKPWLVTTGGPLPGITMVTHSPWWEPWDTTPHTRGGGGHWCLRGCMVGEGGGGVPRSPMTVVPGTNSTLVSGYRPLYSLVCLLISREPLLTWVDYLHVTHGDSHTATARQSYSSSLPARGVLIYSLLITSLKGFDIGLNWQLMTLIPW